MSRAKPEPVASYHYRRVIDFAELALAADLFRRAPDWHYSRATRHTGRVAWVADQLGLHYGHAARLIWDAGQEGLIQRDPMPPEAALVALAELEEVS